MCNVLNASSAPRTGTLEILDLTGTFIQYGGYNAVAPGGGPGIEVQQFQSQALIDILYARVTVDDQPDSIRASLVLTDAHGNTEVSLEAR